MNSKPATPVDPAILKELAEATTKYLVNQAANSSQILADGLKVVQNQTADLAKRWPDALAKAGLSKDAASYEKLARSLRSPNGHLNLDATTFEIGLRFRDALASLGADSATLTAAAPVPKDRAFSSGLGAVLCWPYLLDMTVQSAPKPEVQK